MIGIPPRLGQAAGELALREMDLIDDRLSGIHLQMGPVQKRYFEPLHVIAMIERRGADRHFDRARDGGRWSSAQQLSLGEP